MHNMIKSKTLGVRKSRIPRNKHQPVTTLGAEEWQCSRQTPFNTNSKSNPVCHQVAAFWGALEQHTQPLQAPRLLCCHWARPLTSLMKTDKRRKNSSFRGQRVTTDIFYCVLLFASGCDNKYIYFIDMQMLNSLPLNGSMRDRCFILNPHTQTAAEFQRNCLSLSYFPAFLSLVQILSQRFDLGSVHLCVCVFVCLHVHALYAPELFDTSLPVSKSFLKV